MRPEIVAGAVVAGRYRLDRLIAEGGMGVVWAATHLITRAPVALKLLRADATGDATNRRRLIREARAAGAVQHPNVVRVHDVMALDDGSPILVMDLLIGESLRDRIEREKTLSIGDTAAILIEVASAVGTAHALGIIHRDLKPENVFLVATGGEGSRSTAKVLDFGIAKFTAFDGSVAQTAALTNTGSILGTPYYMAPEQILGEADIDHRADIWALGILLDECLTGARPTDDENLGKVLRRILTDALRPLASAAPGLPDEIHALAARMLSADREQRPTLAEVRDVLQAFTDVRAPAFDPPVRPGEAPSSPRGSRNEPGNQASARDPDSAENLPTVEVVAPVKASAASAEAKTLTAPALIAAEAIAPDPLPAPASARAATPTPTPTPTRGATLAIGLLVALSAAAIAARAVVHGAPTAVVKPVGAAPTIASSPRCPDATALIPGGDFLMGAADGKDEERPVHRVAVGELCVDRAEVTVAAYTACVAAGGCRPASASVAWDGISNEDSQTESAACGAYMSDHDDHPINCVSWTQATAFCATQGKRLPTEAEWEYAAGSGAEHRRYSWGDSPPSSTLLNACGAECSTWFAARGRKLAPMYPGDDGFRITAPAGTFPAGDTAHGLHDMIGNVWEWTSSPYCVYPAHECQSPHKVFRGGGFATASAVNARASSRLYSNPEHRYMDVGFRCVKAPTP